MLLKSNKYISLFVQRTGFSLVLIVIFEITAFSQNPDLGKYIKPSPDYLNHGGRLSSILLAAIKTTLKPNPQINERFKRPNNQLMSWPNYPLTAAQIAARDARYDRPITRQIIEDIAESYVNSILNGTRKKPVATVPKF